MRWEIDLATNDEGLQIRDLLADGGPLIECDWSNIAPYWLVARRETGEIIGAMMVAPGRPMGRMDFLCVKPDLLTARRRRVIFQLLTMGLQMLAAQGIEFVASTIPWKREDYRRVLANRGCKVVDQGWLVLRGTHYGRIRNHGGNERADAGGDRLSEIGDRTGDKTD